MDNTEGDIVLVKDRKRKRHRGGTSSRSHHHKKFKEPLVCASSDEVVLASKTGIESCTRTAPEAGAAGGTVGGGLRLCKGYVDNVNLVYRFPFSLIIIF